MGVDTYTCLPGAQWPTISDHLPLFNSRKAFAWFVRQYRLLQNPLFCKIFRAPELIAKAGIITVPAAIRTPPTSSIRPVISIASSAY